MVPKNLGYFSRSSAAEMECRGISSVEGASGWNNFSLWRDGRQRVSWSRAKIVVTVCTNIPASHRA